MTEAATMTTVDVAQGTECEHGDFVREAWRRALLPLRSAPRPCETWMAGAT